MKRVFFSTPYPVRGWDKAIKSISSCNTLKVVGQLHSTDLSDFGKIEWPLYNVKKVRNDLLLNKRIKYNNEVDVNKLWEFHDDVFKLILCRDYIFHFNPKDVFVRSIYYWIGKLVEAKPDVVFFNMMPHKYLDYTLYVAAKELQIRTVIPRLVPGMPKAFLTYSIKFNESKDSYLFSNGKLTNYCNKSEILEKYKKISHLDYKKAKPSYMKSQNEKYGELNTNNDSHSFNIYNIINKIATHFNNPIPKAKSLYYKFYYKKLCRKKLKQKYDTLAVKANYKVKYIYVPLNYQPERTTSPEGGEMANYKKFIKMLINTSPKDCYIYIKEHPSQFMLSDGVYVRSKEFYEWLSGIDNIRLISLEEDQFNLIDNSFCVITVAGTATIEALMRNKPATVAGYPWFYPGIKYPANNEKLLKHFFDNIKNVNKMKNYIETFMCFLDECSYEIYMQYNTRSYKKQISNNDNVENMKKIINDSI